ncbi:MAG: 16S rRNA (adenine(1518)-N(6)/adenine(1519)-N(6))-dimethyltransferase RsmA [Bacteroidaceae bacterium]|nr:16S rRNA (adenine(1518)-N(6)/adenine(1519)-N(6))-dimethyltransferase RsmA [Bacteroidaceae bacterium]
MKAVTAKKRLGQHFLTDLSIAKAIADTVDICPAVPVLEVGPGMGVLTRFLLEKERAVKVVEIDEESVAYLCKNLPQLGEDNIIPDDFLKMHLDRLFDGEQFMLIGNYPYNISSQIFFKMLDYKEYIPYCSGMIQKEVGERLAAKPGTKAYGILGILIQVWYDVEYLFTVDENVFSPPPKVKSAVVRMVRNNRESMECNEELFKKIVKATFNQRRKKLRNSIQQIVGKESPLLADPVLDKRPEQLSIDDFIELTNKVERELA